MQSIAKHPFWIARDTSNFITNKRLCFATLALRAKHALFAFLSATSRWDNQNKLPLVTQPLVSSTSNTLFITLTTLQSVFCTKPFRNYTIISYKVLTLKGNVCLYKILISLLKPKRFHKQAITS